MMMNQNSDVIFAFLKLSRAMRRCPPERREMPFPPAVGRLLECVAANAGVSSRDLCEMLDLRPSSLSEMLSRAEADGLITRTADEADRRMQRITLAPAGQAVVAEMESARNRDAEKKTACLTEEEKAQFCELCNRLSEHIEKLALDLPEGMMPRHPRHHHHHRPERPEDGRPEAPEGRPPFPEGRFRC